MSGSGGNDKYTRGPAKEERVKVFFDDGEVVYKPTRKGSQRDPIRTIRVSFNPSEVLMTHYLITQLTIKIDELVGAEHESFNPMILGGGKDMPFFPSLRQGYQEFTVTDIPVIKTDPVKNLIANFLQLNKINSLGKDVKQKITQPNLTSTTRPEPTTKLSTTTGGSATVARGNPQSYPQSTPPKPIINSPSRFTTTQQTPARFNSDDWMPPVGELDPKTIARRKLAAEMLEQPQAPSTPSIPQTQQTPDKLKSGGSMPVIGGKTLVQQGIERHERNKMLAKPQARSTPSTPHHKPNS